MELQEYYEVPPGAPRDSEPSRYPTNHVRFHPALRMLSGASAWMPKIGLQPLELSARLLREHDAQASLMAPLGSEQELQALRDLMVQGYRGIDANPHLSEPARLLLRRLHLRALRSRGQVLRFQARHAVTIRQQGRLKAPLMIVGLPRTGSTLLQRLLSQDPNARSPWSFEMESPLPPLRVNDDPMADPRIERAGAGIGMLRRLAPGFVEKFAESHPWSATEYEESFVYMLAHNGLPSVNAAQAGLRYSRAFVTSPQAVRPVFRYERRFFTMLDAYRPARSHWVFKAPHYTPYIAQLFDEYPDARVVITHRNPTTVIPSVCRLMESWCIAFDRDGTFDKHRFAQAQLESMVPFVNAPLALRQARPDLEGQIFDCMYQELFADPLGMVRRIYAHFDMEYTGESERRMQRYLEENRQGKHGRHRYSLEEYGLDAQALRERFAPYMDRYGYDAGQGPRAAFGP